MSKIGDRRGIKLKRAVLRVGDGRGFVVSSRNSIGGHERIVITAAHCLPSFPPCAPRNLLMKRLLLPAAALAAMTVAARSEPARTFYGKDGSYQGSVRTYGNQQSFTL
jgi:hypothetical protein